MSRKEEGRIDIQIDFFYDSNQIYVYDDFVLVIDSTGIKLSNRGEWIKEKHGEKSRKGWIKLHVAMDLKTHQVVDIEITDEKVSDSQVGVELVKDSYRALQEQGKRIVKVLADKGYDTYEMFERLKQMGIEPAIMIRNNARVNANGYNLKKTRKVNYHQRWHIESFFSAFKRIFGEYVVSKTSNHIIKELVFKIFLMNMLMKV